MPFCRQAPALALCVLTQLALVPRLCDRVHSGMVLFCAARKIFKVLLCCFAVPLAIVYYVELWTRRLFLRESSER